MRLLKNHFWCVLGISALMFSASSVSLMAWTDGEPISNGPGSLNPSPSTLAIDQNSNAIAGWLDGELGSANTLYTASLPSSAFHWNSPVTLYSGSSPYFSSFPLLYPDGNGNIKALWANFQQGETSYDETALQSSSLNTLGSNWPAPIGSVSLSGFPNGGGAGVDEVGNTIGVLALAADSNTYGPPFSINFSALANGSTAWTIPVVLGIDNSNSSPAVFVSAKQGKGLVGWKNSPALSLETIRYNFADDSFQNLNAIPLPSGTSDVGFIQGELSANGDAAVAFSVKIGNTNNYVIYSSFLPANSSSWTFPELVSDPENNTIGNFFSLKIDKHGNSTLLWGELTASNNVFIRSGTLTFGSTIANVNNLTDPNPPVSITAGDGSGLSLGVDSFGNAVAIWQLLIDNVPTVQVASREATDNWTAPVDLSTNGILPKIALSNQGTAVAIWMDTVTNYIYASRSDALFALAPPSAFGGYVAEESGGRFLHLHWNPSLAPNVVNYEIFRGDELIANVAGTGPFTYVQDLGCSTEVGEYTLVAAASNSNKSDPIPLILAE